MRTANLAMAGIFAVAVKTAGGAVLHEKTAHSQKKLDVNSDPAKMDNDAVFHFQTARNYSIETKDHGRRADIACLALSLSMGEMIRDNLSYADIGTTKEKFDMIKEYNHCKFE